MDRSTQRNSLELLANTLKPVSALMLDAGVQEIMINGPDNIWVERSGCIERYDAKISEIQIRSAISVLARLERKEAKEGTRDGIIDSRMDGMRVAGVLSPTAVHGHAIAIRKHSPVHLSLEDYAEAGAFRPARANGADRGAAGGDERPADAAVAAGGDALKSFLRWMVKARKNAVVAGGTSSGKTTFLNALIAEFDARDRVITIEDTPELKVRVPNRVSLESNEQAGVTTRDLVRLALRFRPDRLIVGEVRGGEAYDLMQAANTGHEGCLATVHANSAVAALSRLETLVLSSGTDWPHAAIQAEIARTFQFVVFMSRREKVRVLEEVVEISGFNRQSSEYGVKHIYRRSA